MEDKNRGTLKKRRGKARHHVVEQIGLDDGVSERVTGNKEGEGR